MVSPQDCGHSTAQCAAGTKWRWFPTEEGISLCPPCATRHLTEQSQSKRTRILWLDDYLFNFLHKVWEVCNHLDLGIVPVTTNDEALALLEDSREKFDGIVQDLQRPAGRCLDGADTASDELTGFVFYERLVQRTRPSLPCVFVTASAYDTRLRAHVRQLANCVMVPKNDPLGIYEGIRHVLGRR